MDDLVSRNWLLAEYDRRHVGPRGGAYQMILDAPSAERPTGRWIRMSDADGEYYCCDQCGEELNRYITEAPSFSKQYPSKYSIDKTNFCPNCGAKMEVQDERLQKVRKV